MPIWKRNLIVCWFGLFVSAIGMSQIAPVLPLYIQYLGINNTALVEQLSGIAFGVTFIVSAIFSPIWGHAADKYGRKPMLLRASLGMAIVIFVTGLVNNVYQLIGLRFLLGTITGFNTACTILIAVQTDKEYAGWALGTLSTAAIAGSLLGPMIGGFIEENLGMQNVFFITGALLFIAFLTIMLFVKETFHSEDKEVLNTREAWKAVPYKTLTITMFVTFFMISMALYSIEPIVTVYVTQLSNASSHVALLAGMAFSASGLANIIAAPRLGRLSDRVGPQKVLLMALIVGGIILIPQALVKNTRQLIILRFVLGLATAGLNPSVNTLIKKITPDSLTGRVFGFNMSAMYLGAFAGPVLGGQVAAYWGIRSIFFVTGFLLLINAVWVYFKVYKRFSISLPTSRQSGRNAR